jgi:hypothetical protein
MLSFERAHVGEVMTPWDACHSLALLSVVQRSRVEISVPDMTSLSNFAEANLTPERGVLLTEQFTSGLVGRRPGFVLLLVSSSRVAAIPPSRKRAGPLAGFLWHSLREDTTPNNLGEGVRP